ncbi:UNVERIFIED_CONTAM: protein NOI4 [Sesamum calycinum]|uniref:Protein NOI4 n=1 Tax=Sesamum calycinum TaxID=2727403 RepID=A0AAW2MCS6_9LAMI
MPYNSRILLYAIPPPGEKGRPLPKFGEWDVNDPASAEGFTVIFNKARDEKKTGGKPDSPTKVDSSTKACRGTFETPGLQPFFSTKEFTVVFGSNYICFFDNVGLTNLLADNVLVKQPLVQKFCVMILTIGVRYRFGYCD